MERICFLRGEPDAKMIRKLFKYFSLSMSILLDMLGQRQGQSTQTKNLILLIKLTDEEKMPEEQKKIYVGSEKKTINSTI